MLQSATRCPNEKQRQKTQKKKIVKFFKTSWGVPNPFLALLFQLHERPLSPLHSLTLLIFSLGYLLYFS
jgi:hypothetical protein